MSPADLLFYLAAFAVALGTLIVAHEMGHFLVARALGIKVLRFSVGFGRPLLLRRFGADQTEWVIAAFPLGGYVKMLDEREGEVAPAELPRAFNRQPVAKRFLVVLAGPVANLLLAIALYWLLFMQGTEELRPLLAQPPVGSAAAAAQLADGDLVRRVDGKAVATWQELRWELLQSALEHPTVVLEVINQRQEIAERRLDSSTLSAAELDAEFTQRLGLLLYRPQLKPIVGRVAADSVADKAGLRPGDLFVAIDGRPVHAWNEVADTIRSASGKRLQCDLQRGQQVLRFDLTPAAVNESGSPVGRIGIVVRDDPAARAMLLTVIRYPPWTGLHKAAQQTWDTSLFTLRMMGRMLTGELSWKNLSGPVTIADYAGQSARLGWMHYLKFLALISISLGVLNLLPVPVLDGGHLLYYMVEVIKGGPLSERAMEIGQQIGLLLLILLMAFAFYNDINRLVSG